MRELTSRFLSLRDPSSSICVLVFMKSLHLLEAKVIDVSQSMFGSYLILYVDLQMVRITLRVLSKPDVNKLPTIYRTLGLDWDHRVLPSIVNEVSKSVVVRNIPVPPSFGST